MSAFCRFQSAVPNRRGSYPGFFALLKGLEQTDRFTPDDRQVWTEIVARSYALHTEPPAGSYEHPGARSWFRSSASDLRTLALDACAVLDRYAVPWVELRTASPGRVVYEDEVQVVAVPFRHEDDWPF